MTEFDSNTQDSILEIHLIFQKIKQLSSILDDKLLSDFINCKAVQHYKTCISSFYTCSTFTLKANNSPILFGVQMAGGQHNCSRQQFADAPQKQ